jgi:Zn-dependent protease with chaperone function
MSARLILHIIVTIVLFTIGWWLYVRLEDSNFDAIDSVSVATYWFAALVYILISWLFYWFVHRLKLKAWVVAQIITLVISAFATGALLYVSREHQQQLEEKALLEKQQAETLNTDEEQAQNSASISVSKPKTLNLSEEDAIELEPEPRLEQEQQ